MLAEQIETIIQKEKDIIPLLKTLTPAQKKELVPSLKKLREKFFERYDETEKTQWGNSYTTKYKYSETKRNIISQACYVCFNKTDLKKAFFNVSNLSVSDPYLENIIPWYTPKWYGDLINEEMPWDLDYGKMMILHKQDLLQPSHALILARLPNAIVERTRENNQYKNEYKPEILFRHRETLEEHIWFLFEEESGINNIYNYSHIENYKGGNDIWIDTITKLTAENKLDRKRVLVATIYSSTKGFNKNLSGWFFDLLQKLNPTQDEVLRLQKEFFAALNSPHSKVVNTVLKYFKLVATQKKFQYNTFINNSSILLNSETKSVVNSTLMILEKIARTHKSSGIAICKKAAEALINVDEIQLRAAKIIAQYGDPENQELLEEIRPYSENIFHTSKEKLQEYIVLNDETEDYEYEVEETIFLSEEKELPTYETLDDLIFFVSQAIDNNEVYHLDLLLNYLPKLNVLLNRESVVKLEPIIKRSFDLSMSLEGNSQIGFLESEAAYYINDFAEILMKKFPDEFASFRKIKDQKIEKLKEDRYYNSHYKKSLKEIENKPIPDYIYQIHHFLFIKSKSFIKKGLTLDLLSTPTHAPCWINPEVFIDRIISYEASEEEVNLFDFQIGMGRLPMNEHPIDTITQIEKIKNNEIKNVLKYHFGLLDIQNINILRPELWLQSVLSKNNDLEVLYFQENLANQLQKEKGAYEWDCKLREHFYEEYDYGTGKKVQKKIMKKELEFKDFHLQKVEPKSLISNLKCFLNRKKKTIEVSSIYKFMFFKKQQYYTTIQPHDEVKFLFLSPNNPGSFLSNVVHHNLKESTFFNESSKKNMVNLMKGLYEIWNRADFKESTYLFLATGLLCSDKVSRDIAAEIWIKASSEKNINNKLLGQILGRLEYGEYAPLKRFTDLLSASLFNVSKVHNESLISLLENMISHMNSNPIRGVKNLLELFLELKLGFPEKDNSELLEQKLIEWKETSTLKSLICKIKNN